LAPPATMLTKQLAQLLADALLQWGHAPFKLLLA
jgi:hypothetical protein